MGLEDDILPSICEEEEDGESVRSGSPAKGQTGDANANGATQAGAPSTSSGDSNEKKDKKKDKKEKRKSKKDLPAHYSGEDHDTAQQILVDLCTQMKELKNSMQEGQEKSNEHLTSNLDANHKVMKSLTDQMEMVQDNMRQLDQVIESKATPEQIDDLARIRAVQEMIKSITDDKERTVGIYEAHARRGYEEIERLRQDLAAERKEVSALRSELDMVRGDRQRMAVNGPSPANMYINAGDGGSVGGDSAMSGKMNNSFVGLGGSKYLNGSKNFSGSGMGGDHLFDDMTLETKGSYETTAYEMKTLKKRIIHMKKKLTVAQLEVKETETLRAGVEKLRVQCELEKKASIAKDETIKRLEGEIEILKRTKADAVVKARPSPVETSPQATNSPPPKPSHSGISTPSYGSSSGKASHIIKSKKSKWWQQL